MRLTQLEPAPSVAADSLTATIFGIERFCTRDGPGIRTTVFFKGCPLRCAWCHNPEGLSRPPGLSFAAEHCIACGACASVCEHGAQRIENAARVFDRRACVACLSCVPACPAGALEVVGREVTVEEVMHEILQDRVFYPGSGGGLTLSGGEPTAQIDFAVALLQQARAAGIHCAVETSGSSPWKDFARLLPLVDLFLFDFKESDPRLHLEYTGQSNETILANLRALHDSGAAIQLQCPIVPGYNDREEHLGAIIALAKEIPRIMGVTLLGFHPLGTAKLQRLGLPDRAALLQPAEQDKLEAWRKAIREQGITVLG